jgi:hypothetical protein
VVGVVEADAAQVLQRAGGGLVVLEQAAGERGGALPLRGGGGRGRAQRVEPQRAARLGGAGGGLAAIGSLSYAG